MRKVLLIAMLSIFVVSWLKPYFPYLDYLINKEYIAENLCENKEKPELQCNGKCHLKKEVQKAAEEVIDSEEGPQKNPTGKVKVKINLIDQLPSCVFVLNDIRSERKTYAHTNESVRTALRDVPTPPPRVSLFI